LVPVKPSIYRSLYDVLIKVHKQSVILYKGTVNSNTARDLIDMATRGETAS